MDKISKKLQNFLQEYSLNNPEYVYLVGFSGGYDSLCLLHALRNNCSNKIIAIHLNHNWRGEESNFEEKKCSDFCKKNNIDFYSETLPTEFPQNETAARQARYDFFDKCIEKFGAKALFTAHNKNDQAETLIFRICHGTGIVGLQGISPKRGVYYRPLLNILRSDIEDYCNSFNLSPNHDTSNLDTIHKRNLIRHDILPKMKEINPNIIEALCSLSELAKEENEIIKTYLNFDKVINSQTFISHPESVQTRIIYELVTPYIPENYDRKRILTIKNFITENISSKSGKIISITTNKWLFVNNQKIEIISNTKQEPLNVAINKLGDYTFSGGRISISECSKLDKHKKNAEDITIYADLSKFNFNFDFALRNRKNGDFIQPLGMQGHQKLKKYLNERKIPNHEKSSLMLLTHGNEVLWVVGIGISEKIKCVSAPTHKIVIRKVKDEY